MNRSRVLLPAAAGVVLLGVGVYFSGGGLSGDASEAGCGAGEVVDVQQDVGQSDSHLTTLVNELAGWDAERLRSDAATFDSQLQQVIDAGSDAVPALTSAIQSNGCNEPASGRLADALHEIIVDKAAILEGVQGVASVAVSAAVPALTDYEVAGEDAPTFSDYPELDDLAKSLRVGDDVPAVRAWIDDPSRRAEMAGDDEQTACGLRLLDVVIALDSDAGFERLVAAVQNDVPAGHPGARELVEAAIALKHTRTDAGTTLAGLARDKELHPNARGMACFASAFDEGGVSTMPLSDLTAEDLAPEFARCSLLTTAPDLGLELAQALEDSNDAMVRVAVARAIAANQRGAELEQLLLQIIQGQPAYAEGVCGLEGVICGHGELTAQADALVGIAQEDPDAAANLRERLEAAVAEATPDEKARITVLARAAADLWETPIPGLEY